MSINGAPLPEFCRTVRLDFLRKSRTDAYSFKVPIVPKTGQSILEQLQATKAAGRQHRTFILARRQEIEEAIRGGYTVLAIWQHLHDSGSIRCTYKTFLANLKRIGISPSPGPELLHEISQKPEKPEKPTTRQPEATNGKIKQRFDFSASPDPEELA